MIYYKFVIILISTALASCQGKTTFTMEETSENSLRINSKTNSLSLDFKNGSISSIHAINHDSKNGNSWEFYPDGSIKNKYNYRNGTIVNAAYEYFNNGSLRVKGKSSPVMTNELTLVTLWSCVHASNNSG